MARSSKTTTDHDTIREWVQARNGKPAAVNGTGAGDDPGMIRIDMPGYSGADSLRPISWDEWFRAFDDNGLALVYQDETARGERSNFNELVARSTTKRRSRSAKRGTKSRASTRGTRTRASGSRATSSRGTSSRGSSHRGRSR